jgi:hypothetical protein
VHDLDAGLLRELREQLVGVAEVVERAMVAAPATAAAMVRREVLTVTPLCAWMGTAQVMDAAWERSHFGS